MGEDEIYSIRMTKSKTPNELGLFDMSGNVEEYCISKSDSYTYYGYVARGGNYSDVASDCRITSVEEYPNRYTMGLRLAISSIE